MTAAGPWSVKGIDPKAREIAKDLARRSGLTLGEWLNQMIIEGEPEGPPAPAAASETRRRALDDLYREARNPRPAPPAPVDAGELTRVTRTLDELALRMEAAEQRSGLAISGVDRSVLGVLSRLDAMEREQGASAARAEGAASDARNLQTRIADKLQRLEHEDAARASTLGALETALDRAAEQAQAADARVETLAGEVQETRDRLSDRLEAVETAVARAPDAYADADKVDVVLTRMAERLDQAESRTTAAVQSLQSSFGGLDARLRSAETRGGGPTGAEIEGRFQNLAQDLARRVDASRAELAERLRSAGESRLDGLEAALREVRGQVAQAEQRSAQAIDHIGREVIRAAQGLNARVSSLESAAQSHAADLDARMAEVETRSAEAEARSAAAVETMGGEVARIADAMEGRARSADGVQAEALEKLGAEITRIAERLADRISSSDRRAAEALDEVTERVAKLGERMDARHERSAIDLAERIRESEERTAKLLDGARERLEQTLSARPRGPASDGPPPTSAALHNADPFGLPTDFEPDEPTELELSRFERQTPPLSVSAPAYTPPSAAEPPPVFVEAPASTPPKTPVLASDDFAHGDPFAERPKLFDEPYPFDPEDDFVQVAPAAKIAAAPFAELPLGGVGPAFAPEPKAAPSPEEPEPPFAGFSVGDFVAAPEAQVGPTQMSTRDMLEAARQAARTASGRPEAESGAGRAPRPFGLTLPGRRKKDGPTLRTVALSSVTAVAITTAAVGAYMLGGASSHDGEAETPPVPDTAAAAPAATPSLAVAITPPAAADRALDIPAEASPPRDGTAGRRPAAAAIPPAPKPTALDARAPHALYTAAVNRIETGDLAGVADLRLAAAQGDPAAQFYLARLYEAGGAGVAKDLAQARAWTEKAAQGGEPMAMYNLASYAYAGDGGAKDLPTAVAWFRRAADRGVVNGQYNLAQLYERGYGVPQDLGQAYSWYKAAADAGDAGARTAAAALRPRLSPAVLAEADRRALALQGRLAAAAPNPAIRSAAVKSVAAKAVP